MTEKLRIYSVRYTGMMRRRLVAAQSLHEAHEYGRFLGRYCSFPDWAIEGMTVRPYRGTKGLPLTPSMIHEMMTFHAAAE